MGQCSSCCENLIEESSDNTHSHVHQPDKSDNGIRQVTATVDYQGTLLFKFQQGDTIVILREDNAQQMMYGRVQKNGKEGYFPNRCIQYIQTTNSNPETQQSKKQNENTDKLSTINKTDIEHVESTRYASIPLPKNIFYTKTSLTVVAGYSRSIHPTITSRLPNEIIDLLWKFCIEPELINTIRFGIIEDNAEHVFETLELKYNKNIVSTSGVLKLTVLKDLIIDNNSEIRCDFGTLIINVYGNVYITNESVIVAEGDGNIYIKTLGNVMLKSGSCIRTCKSESEDSNKIGGFHTEHKTCNAGNLRTLYGNIYMFIENDLNMNSGATLESGDIKIVCQNTVSLDDSVVMNAFRNNINVQAQVGLNVNSKLNDKLTAKNQKIFVLNSVLK